MMNRKMPALVMAALVVVGCGDLAEESGGAASEPAETAAPLTVEHELGTTEVPADVERIVTVDSGETMAHLLVLGHEPPLAAGSYFPQSEDPWPGLPDDMADELEAQVEVFDRTEPPLETIAGLQPDLIIGPSFYMEQDVYDLLSQIAPTVATNEFGEGGGWQVALGQVGEALGQRDVAEALINEFEGEVADRAASLDNAVDTVSVVSVRPESVRIWREALSEAALIADLGVELTPTAADFDQSILDPDVPDRIDVSPELIPAIDGEALVLRQDTEDAEESAALEDIRSGPLWQGLPAVESDRVLVVGTYTFTGGLYGYRDFIDEVATFLDGSAG